VHTKWNPNRQPNSVCLAKATQQPKRLVAVVAGVTCCGASNDERHVEYDARMGWRTEIAAGWLLASVGGFCARCFPSELLAALAHNLTESRNFVSSTLAFRRSWNYLSALLPAPPPG